MNTRKLLASVLTLVSVLLSACAPVATAKPPSPTAIPTTAPTAVTETKSSTPDYVEGVGRIISMIPASAALQKIHVGQDVLWFWEEECYCVVHFDEVSGKEIASLNVVKGTPGRYGNPKDMAVDGKMVWATDAGHQAVVRIDPDTNQIVEQIPLKFTDASGNTVKISPMGLALDGTTLWVSDFDKNYVVRLDIESKEIVAVISDVINPEGIAVSPGAVWVVEHRSNQIVRIDPSTNKIIELILIPTPENVFANGSCRMCIDYVVATKDSVWVPLDRGMGVARIDPVTNQVIAVIPLEFMARNVAVGDNAIWVAGSPISGCMSNLGGVARIDPQTNTVVGMISIPCAFSVAVAHGFIWVGTGNLGGSPSITQIKPD